MTIALNIAFGVRMLALLLLVFCGCAHVPRDNERRRVLQEQRAELEAIVARNRAAFERGDR